MGPVKDTSTSGGINFKYTINHQAIINYGILCEIHMVEACIHEGWFQMALQF